MGATRYFRIQTGNHSSGRYLHLPSGFHQRINHCSAIVYTYTPAGDHRVADRNSTVVHVLIAVNSLVLHCRIGNVRRKTHLFPPEHSCRSGMRFFIIYILIMYILNFSIDTMILPKCLICIILYLFKANL